MTNRHETDLVVTEETLKKKRGRPKCFDEQEVLQKAMLLFWEHGAFGDKAGLFYKSIDYYLAHEA